MSETPIEAMLTPRLQAVTDVFADMEAHWQIVDALFGMATVLDADADQCVADGMDDLAQSLRDQADQLERHAKALEAALSLDPKVQ